MKKLRTEIIDNYHSVMALIFGLLAITICITPYLLMLILYLTESACLFFGIPLIVNSLAIIFGYYSIVINAGEMEQMWYKFGLFGVIAGSISILLFIYWILMFFMVTP